MTKGSAKTPKKKINKIRRKRFQAPNSDIQYIQ